MTSPRSTLIKEAGTINIDEDVPTYYQKISNEANGIFKEKSESLIKIFCDKARSAQKIQGQFSSEDKAAEAKKKFLTQFLSPTEGRNQQSAGLDRTNEMQKTKDAREQLGGFGTMMDNYNRKRSMCKCKLLTI